MIEAILTHFAPTLAVLGYAGALALVVWILNRQETKD